VIWAENVRTRQLVPVRLKPGSKNDDDLEKEAGGERGSQDPESEETSLLLPPDLVSSSSEPQAILNKKQYDSLSTHVNVVVFMRVCFLFFQVTQLPFVSSNINYDITYTPLTRIFCIKGAFAGFSFTSLYVRAASAGNDEVFITNYQPEGTVSRVAWDFCVFIPSR